MTNLDAASRVPDNNNTVSRKRSTMREQIVLVTIALIGVLVLLYPSTAAWFSSLNEQGSVNGYIQRIEQLPSAERQEWLDKADAYNNNLVHGLIVDPFSNTPGGEATELDEAALEYIDQLSFDDRGVMSRLRIPKIDVDLPVYHGATDEILRKGVGHLYGSSMPVGGGGSHPVLTGHSGLPESELFTDLFDLQLGDTFQVDTVGRTMTYQVFNIDTVEPTDISDLGVVEGRDLVTLVTCTPIGVNSHRLIVQAERIDNPVDQPSYSQPAALKFPWWAVGIGAALLIWLAVVIRALAKRRRGSL